MPTGAEENAVSNSERALAIELLAATQAVEFLAPLEPGRQAARRAGLAMVHQELSLVPTLSIAENCVLGEFPTHAGIVRRRAVRSAGVRALELVGLKRDPLDPVSRLSFAERQLVEIGRCLLEEPRVLVLGGKNVIKQQRGN